MITVNEQINDVLRIAGVKPLYKEQLDESFGDIAKKGAIICLVSLSMFLASKNLNKEINVNNPSKEEVAAVKSVYDKLIANKNDIKFSGGNFAVQQQYQNDAGVCDVVAGKNNSGNYNDEILSVECSMPRYNKRFKMVTDFSKMTDKSDNTIHSIERHSNHIINNDTDSKMEISVEDATKMANMINNIKSTYGFANSNHANPTEPSDIQNYTSQNDGSTSIDYNITDTLQKN